MVMVDTIESAFSSIIQPRLARAYDKISRFLVAYNYYIAYMQTGDFLYSVSIL